MLMKINRNFPIVTIIFTWLLLFTIPFSAPTHAAELGSEQQKLNSVRELIEDYYYQDVSPAVLQKSSIDQILANLDKYTEYMSNEDYQSFLNSISQQVVGIGVQVEKVETGLSIINVFSDGGAAQLGMKAGDILVEADGVDLAGLALEVAITKVTGQAGTEVDLKFYRPSENKYHNVTVVRKIVKAPLVDSEMLGGKVGFIRLNSFGEEATNEMTAAIEKISGADRFIFDLRNNGGGYFNIARETVGFFPAAKNAILLDQQNEKNLLFSAFEQKIKFSKPVSVLINEYSASASEIVAAAVADYDAASLYGQTSFGKGTMQTMYAVTPELGSESDVIKLTTGEFFSPLGNKINQVGVTPDVVTEVGFELVEAHEDALAAIFADYESLDGVVASADPEELIIQFADATLLDEVKVDVVELGAPSVPIATEKTSSSELSVTFSNLLDEKSEYVVLLHLNDVSLEEAGYQVPLTVSSGGDDRPVISIGTSELTIFKDVVPDQTIGYAEILELAREEIFLGYPDRTFRPNEKISRLHVALLIQRQFELEIPSNLAEVLAVYDDVDASHPFAGEIAAVTASDIFKGGQGKFLPNEKITRSEMATVFVRAFNFEGSEDIQISLQDLDQIRLAEHQENVRILAQNGVIRGRPNGRGSYYFDGPAPLTRAEFAIMLVNARNK